MIRAAAIVLALAASLAGCGGEPSRGGPPAAVGGDPARGASVIGQAECGACHEIPGIADAHGLVGPPLEHFGRRTMVAGVLPNTPDALEHWLVDPQAVTPGNGMPATGLNEQQARDVTAYLYTLR